jgi:hypothetical protein
VGGSNYIDFSSSDYLRDGTMGTVLMAMMFGAVFGSTLSFLGFFVVAALLVCLAGYAWYQNLDDIELVTVDELFVFSFVMLVFMWGAAVHVRWGILSALKPHLETFFR